MGNLIHLTGKRFNKLLVEERTGSSKGGQALWRCKCNCGNESIVAGTDLRRKSTKSCGCAKNITHGRAKHPLYKVWKGMIRRCTNPNYKYFKNYGGRGIKVCSRWLDIHNFIADMGLRPSPKHTIERIDNNKGYFPDNCRWATRAEQQKNMRTNRMLTLEGRTMCAAEWARRLNIAYTTILWRLNTNKSIEQVLKK